MSALPGPADGRAREAAATVRARTDVAPRVAIILGSGLGDALTAMDVAAEIPFDELPGFPPAGVAGHAGRLRLGVLAGVPVAAFLGRVHFYEGHPMDVVTLPVRLAAELGVRTLIVTAATGGLAPDLVAGGLVIGSDHLNLIGENPLRGWRDADGRPVFPDLSELYDAGLADVAERAARDEGLPVRRGVYAAMSGPMYETPAEIAFLRLIGADVVGMSVVPETTAAAALGLRCLGLYCVANVVGGSVSHEEVLEAGAAFARRLGPVIERVLATT